MVGGRGGHKGVVVGGSAADRSATRAEADGGSGGSCGGGRKTWPALPHRGQDRGKNSRWAMVPQHHHTTRGSTAWGRAGVDGKESRNEQAVAAWSRSIRRRC